MCCILVYFRVIVREIGGKLTGKSSMIDLRQFFELVAYFLTLLVLNSVIILKLYGDLSTYVQRLLNVKDLLRVRSENVF